MINDFINEVKGSLKKPGGDLPFGEKTSRTDYVNPIEITGFIPDYSDTKYYTAGLEDDVYIKLAEPVIVGKSYTVVWDGQVYNATLYEDENLTYFGRNYYWLDDNPDNLPFGIVLDSRWDAGADRTFGTEIRLVFTDSSTAESHTLEIYKENVEITPLPHKYLDIVETVGTDTLTWDGKTEGLEVGNEYYEDIEADSYATFNLYRISETTPSFNILTSNGCEITFDNVAVDKYDAGDSRIEFIGNNLGTVDWTVFIAYEDNTTYTDDYDTLNFPKKGIYVYECVPGESCITAFTIPGYTGFQKEQVRTRFMPSSVDNAIKDVADKLATNDWKFVSQFMTGVAGVLKVEVPQFKELKIIGGLQNKETKATIVSLKINSVTVEPAVDFPSSQWSPMKFQLSVDTDRLSTLDVRCKHIENGSILPNKLLSDVVQNGLCTLNAKEDNTIELDLGTCTVYAHPIEVYYR